MSYAKSGTQGLKKEEARNIFADDEEADERLTKHALLAALRAHAAEQRLHRAAPRQRRQGA